MADGKNSFVLYTDMIHTVEKLDDATAGQLLKHILKYVNDENPVAENVVVEIAFEPVKQNLKRDLQKYKKTCERNKANIEKRWKNDIPKDTKNTTGKNGIPLDTKNTDNDNELSKDNYKSNSDLSVDWEAFRLAFNEITGKSIRVIDDKTKKQLKARLKEGYTKEDIVTAIENCRDDTYHKESGLKYLTPEFISRPDKFQKYASMGKPKLKAV